MTRKSLFANVWHTDRIARIDPRSGDVRGWIDLEGLLPERRRADRAPLRSDGSIEDCP